MLQTGTARGYWTMDCFDYTLCSAHNWALYRSRIFFSITLRRNHYDFDVQPEHEIPF